MESQKETCARLRRLYDQITRELNALKKNKRDEEAAGVQNTLETQLIVRSLQHTLNTLTQEIEKCPPPEE